MGYLAIIPARSGSKGLKDKNIKLLNGKPLFYYSIKAAIDSKCFDEILVSTDSERYKKLAIECGASVPFLRSPENSGDKSKSWDAVRECIDKYKENGKTFDGFMLLQPTSPLRTSEDIVNAFKIFKKRKADTVLSVVEAEHSPLFYSTVPKSLNLKKMLGNKYFNKARQELPTYYRLNGAIYLSTMKNFDIDNCVYHGKVLAYVMPQSRSVDIDIEDDFLYAEFLINHRI